MASVRVKFIKENSHLSDVQICKELNICEKKLAAIRYWNNIERQDRSWTTEKEEYLKKWYGKKTYTEMSTFIGKSPSAIADKAKHMGVSTPRSDND